MCVMCVFVLFDCELLCILFVIVFELCGVVRWVLVVRLVEYEE